MEKEYELIRLVKGYILVELQEVKEIDLTKSSLAEVRKNDIKIVASSEIIDDLTMADYSMLRIEDCNDLFGIKETIEANVSEQYKDAEYRSIEQYKGILELIRHKMYNYLSGRTTHKEFVKDYTDFQEFLGEHDITKINGFVNWGEVDDERDDDEYFNDDLEAEELSRELPKTKTKVRVNVMSLHDEQNCVVMFPKINLEVTE
mgnify:CR=1 FL=1